jgi:autotransporter-associated beta strand protein
MKTPSAHRLVRSNGTLAARIFAGAIATLLAAQSAHAISLSWDGLISGSAGGGAGTWNTNTTANWWDGGANVVWPNSGTDNDAVFAGTAGTVTLSPLGVTANDLTFNSTGYTLQGGVLTLNGTTPTITTGPSVSTSILSTIAGTAGLTKSGDGTLVLHGENTYSGSTIISAGVLNIQRGAAMGTSSVSVTSGAALQIQGTFNIGNTLTLNGTGVSNDGALRNISGASKYNGNLTLGSATRINSDAGILRIMGTLNTSGNALTVGGAGQTSFWGAISGAGSLTVDGTGMVNLGGSNTYTGGTNINSGTVFLSNGQALGTTGTISFSGGTLQYSGSNTADYSARFSTAASQNIKINTSSQAITFGTALTSVGGSLSVTGQGTLTLTKQNTYGGTTRVTNNATLLADLNAAAVDNVVSSSSALTLGGKLTVKGTGGVTARSQTFNGTTFDRGSALITPTLNAASATANVLTVDLGAMSRNAGGTSNLVFGTSNVTASNTRILTSSGTADSLITDSNGVAFMTFGTTATSIRDWAVKDSGNTKIIQAPGLFYTAATATTIAGNADIGTFSPTITGAGVDNPVASIRFDSAGARTLTLDDTSTFSVGGILVTSNVGNNATIITGTGTLQGPNNGAGDLAVHNWDTSSSARIDSVIGGSGGFTKSGTGSVILAGSNSYTGPTTIGAGTLQIGNAGTTGDLGATTGTIINDGTLVFNRSAASSDLTVVNDITGSGGLTHSGAGTTILQGNLSYRGLTAVNAGVLTFDTGSARGWTSRGNISTNRGMDGNGLQINANGTVNLKGLFDAETTFISGGVLNVMPDGELVSRNGVGNGIYGLSIGGGEGGGATYGMLNVTGGRVTAMNEINATGQANPRFTVGTNNTSSGGLLRVSDGLVTAINLLSERAEITQLGGTIRTAGGAAPNLNTSNGNANSSNATTVLNVAGGTFDNGTVGINLNGGTAGSARVIINVNSGTLWTQALTQGTGSTGILNFDGGTLKVGAASATFTPLPISNTTSTFSTYINSGGGTIDTNGFNITVQSNLMAPTGTGVTALAVTTGGSGYNGAPIVTINDAGITQSGTTALASNTIAMADTTDVYIGQIVTGTGVPAGSIVTAVTPGTSITISQNASAAGTPTLTFKGQGATAYATYAGGAITGYVVTNPGVGYVGTLSVSLAGGVIAGGTAATVDAVDITTAANTSGGLTKNGAGTLTLSGANTFTGATSVNAGTLAFGATILNTYASDISGPGAVSHTGIGTTILTGSNNFTGLTTLTAGVLQLNTVDALPGGIASTGGSGALTFNGGVLGLGFDDFTRNLGVAGDVTAANFTGAGGWAAYGADRTVNIGGALSPITWATANTGFNGQTLILGATSATHTVDFLNPIDLGTAARTVQANNGAADIDGKISGLLSGGSGGGITKTGTGTLELSGNNTYSGTTSVNTGRLVLSGDNSGSASAMTINSGAIAQFNSLLAIPSTGRTVTNSGTVSFDTSFTAADIPDGLLRITTNSAGAIAAESYASTNFDFAAAGLTAASLGAVGNLTYTGTYTPNTTGGYRLGGSGGTLTMSNTNALTGANALTVIGNVILSASNANTGVTTINASSILTLGNGVTGQNGSVGSASIVNNGTAIIFNNFDNQTFGGVISGAGAVTKSSAGQLTFSTQQTYAGTTTLNAGTLVLAGGNNTLASNKVLVVNTGGTLDLGSNSQYVGNFTGTGGIVTGSGGRFTTNAANGTYAGSIQGSLDFVKAGANTLILTGDNTTSGTINVLGTGLTLKDSGRLSGNTGIIVNGATLTLDNTGASNIDGRVNSASLALNGGTVTYNGANNTASTESFGAVTLDSGVSIIQAIPAGSGTRSAVLNLGSLTRSTGAALNVNPGGNNLGASLAANPHANVLVTGGLTGNLATVNGVVPGVLSAQGDSWDLVGYDNTLGFGRLGTAGFPVNYTGTFAAATAADNLSSVSGAVTAVKTINSINQGTVTFTNGTAVGGLDLLTIGSGMAIMGTQTFGTTSARGRLTSGTQELFIGHRDGNATPSPIIHSVIEDNGNPVSLVVYSKKGDRGPYLELTAANTYGGGTYVSGGNNLGGILLNAGSSSVVIPAGGLTINNLGVVDEAGFQGQIDSSNDVTINGGGMLRLMGANTLASITFNSNGGTQVPTVIPYNTITRDANTNNYSIFGTKTGTLTITGNITSTPTNVAVTPLIDSGTLDLNGTTTHDITVSALPEGNFVNTNTPLNGLTISSVISNGGFTKKGGGVLNLTGAGSTYAGQLTVEEGVLNVASVNNISSNGVLGNSANSVILGGSGGKTGTLEYTGGNTTSSKPFTLATGGSGAFQVDAAATTLTLSGLIGGDGDLAKTGLGTLTLTAAAGLTGDTTIKAGTLKLDGSGSIDSSPNILVGDAGSTGAVLDVTTKSGGFTVGGSQTLSGIGTISGSTTIEGIHAPGNSAGIQTFTGGLAYAAASNLQWQLYDNVTTGRGTSFDGVDVTGGNFSIIPGATLDLSFGGSVSFVDNFWNSAHTWTVADLGSGVTGDGGLDLFTLGSITGGGYSSSEGSFSVTRVADANSKNDVVLNWTASTGSSPYQTWIDSYVAIPVGDRDPEDDYDNDGATNLAEFAFKGVPNDASNRGLFFNEAKDNADGDSDKELTFTCAVRRSAVNFAATANNAQQSGSAIDEVTYTIEGSTTLTGTWNSIVSYVGKSDTAPSGSGLPSLAATDWEYRTFSAFNGMANKGFLRTKVVSP